MLDWFIPTIRNGFRAKLLRAPFLIAITAVVLLANASPLLPKAVVEADIEPDQLLEMHNRERRAAGLAPLRMNTVLSSSAQQKALAMLQTDCWSHFCPDGKSPWEFFASAGYTYLYAGENLAEGFFDNDAVINAWMNSPTHRENILRAEYEEVGFGIVRGDFLGKPNNIVITVHFGTPQYLQTQNNDIPSGELPTPEITAPVNGSATNTDAPVVSGTATGSNAINLFNNGGLWASVDANEGIFTYNPPKLAEGEYSITAQGVAGVRQSAPSTAVAFSIDRTPDTLSTENFLPISYNRDTQLVNVHITKPSLKSVVITISGSEIQFKSESANLWSAEINAILIGKAASMEVLAIDLAGNSWSGSVPADSLQEVLNTLPDRPLVEELTANIAGITVTQSGITWGVVGFLICLFALDFLTLRRTGLSSVHVVRRSQWHLAVLMLLVLVGLTGSLNGHVADGLNVL